MDTSTILEATGVEATGPGPIGTAAVDGFAALANPTRLAILRTLVEAPRCVCDVRDAVPVAPNVLSYHLEVLRDTGLVTAARRGRWVNCALVPGALEALRAAVPAQPDGVPTTTVCRRRR